MTPFEAAVLSGWLKSMTFVVKILCGGLVAWGLIALAEHAYYFWLPMRYRLAARVLMVVAAVSLLMLLLVAFAVSIDMADNPGKYVLPAEAP